jgi:hypothetical protein
MRSSWTKIRETLQAAALNSFTVKCKKGGWISAMVEPHGWVELLTLCPERSLRHYQVNNVSE